jgi:hypothetical protein
MTYCTYLWWSSDWPIYDDQLTNLLMVTKWLSNPWWPTDWHDGQLINISFQMNKWLSYLWWLYWLTYLRWPTDNLSMVTNWLTMTIWLTYLWWPTDYRLYDGQLTTDYMMANWLTCLWWLGLKESHSCCRRISFHNNDWTASKRNRVSHSKTCLSFSYSRKASS